MCYLSLDQDFQRLLLFALGLLPHFSRRTFFGARYQSTVGIQALRKIALVFIHHTQLFVIRINVFKPLKISKSFGNIDTFILWVMHSLYFRCMSHTEVPSGSDGKQSACNLGDRGLITWLERSPKEENCKPLQYSCLENPMTGWAWWTTVQRVAKSQTRLNNRAWTQVR